MVPLPSCEACQREIPKSKAIPKEIHGAEVAHRHLFFSWHDRLLVQAAADDVLVAADQSQSDGRACCDDGVGVSIHRLQIKL